MNVSTTNYTAAHGKAPRGSGRWSFDIGRGGAWTTVEAPGKMTLAEAKKWAIREARALGADRVQVAS